MPRARSHWALLVRTRVALETANPAAAALVRGHHGEFFAGGMAPDALRLFAGRDKASTHYYDDQRPETWDTVLDALCDAQPEIAMPSRLAPPAVAWVLGYLTHLLTDVAYWRYVVTALPPFPAHAGVHHGAWLLADQLSIAPHDKQIDVDTIRFDLAPAWIDHSAVRRMLERVATAPNGILAPEAAWQAELAYVRSHPEARGRSDAELLAERVPLWESYIAAARAALPEHAWHSFTADAVESSVRTICAYLGATR